MGFLINKWMKKYPFPVTIFSYFLSDRDQWKFHCMNEIRNTDDFVQFTPWANMISWDWALQDCPGLSAAVLSRTERFFSAWSRGLSANLSPVLQGLELYDRRGLSAAYVRGLSAVGSHRTQQLMPFFVNILVWDRETEIFLSDFVVAIKSITIICITLIFPLMVL